MTLTLKAKPKTQVFGRQSSAIDAMWGLTNGERGKPLLTPAPTQLQSSLAVQKH